MNPNLVKSPKNKITNVYATFEQKAEGFSLAVLQYGTQRRIGIRWNGNDNEIGYPHSHGYPTWFILPKSVALNYALKVGNQKMIDFFTNVADEPFI